jgi:hypothetical protein
MAAFWGMCEGCWKGPSGLLPSRLIVERIDSESAEVVYVWGDDPQGHFKAGWGRFKAKVLPRGILEFGWCIPSSSSRCARIERPSREHGCREARSRRQPCGERGRKRARMAPRLEAIRMLAGRNTMRGGTRRGWAYRRSFTLDGLRLSSGRLTEAHRHDGELPGLISPVCFLICKDWVDVPRGRQMPAAAASILRDPQRPPRLGFVARGSRPTASSHTGRRALRMRV